MPDTHGDGERADRATDSFPDVPLPDDIHELLAGGFSTEPGDVPIAQFNAVFQRLNITKSGDMLFVLLVPGKQKYAAMQTSDHPNKTLTVTITEYVQKFSESAEAILAELGIKSNPAEADPPADKLAAASYHREHYRDPDEDPGDDGDEFSNG